MDLIPIFNLMKTNNPDELSMPLPLVLDNRIGADGYGMPAAVPKSARITRHRGESLVVKDVDEFQTKSNHSK